ncbi:hypothetical protein ACTXT7_008896 [Hymenolepis weldensis]
MFSFFGSAPFEIVSTISNDGYLFDVEDGVRRSLFAKDSQLPEVLDERLTTVHDLLLEAVRVAGQKPFLGSHSKPSEPYSWLTFKGTYERVCDLGSGLINVCSLDNRSESGKFVGIVGKNCVDEHENLILAAKIRIQVGRNIIRLGQLWVVTEFACATYGLVCVPLYDTLGEEALKHICNHSELTTCVCVSPDLAEKLLDLKSNHLKHIILIQSNESSLKNLRDKADGRVQIHDFSDILIKGKEDQRTPDVTISRRGLDIPLLYQWDYREVSAIIGLFYDLQTDISAKRMGNTSSSRY